MTPTTYQKPEIRDSNDNIIQQGAFGKNTALSNATNDGWIDYVANDLNFLYGLAKDEVVPVSALPASGDMNKTYLLTTTGVCYRWDGTAWVEISSSEAVGRAETAANLAEQWATKTDGTVADNEYSAKYYANAAQQSADDAQDVADDMADHLAQIDQNTGGVSANSKRISNIEKLLQGNLYDYDTDDDTAYTKSVPSGAMPYAGLEQIGGKTLVWNQLCRNELQTNTVQNVTFTNNGDGSWTINGTASGNSDKSLGRFNAIAGHNYFIKVSPANGSSATYYGSISGIYGRDYGDGAIVTLNTTERQNVRLDFKSGVTFDNVTIYPRIIDLTLMFGAGNEPSTVEEFEAMFPADYYAYNAGTLLSAGVTEVVSKDSNNVTLQTISIPTAIRNLEGYGWSAGTAYNYVDFERKVYVQNVGAITLDGTENWAYNGVGVCVAPNIFVVDMTTESSKWTLNNNSAMPDIPWQQRNSVDSCLGNYYGQSYLYAKDPSIQDAATAKAYFTAHPTTVYYRLNVPVETDISAYITEDNLIQVEAGGTLTFPNQNGTDYQIPVPSEETYMIDLQSAIGG